MPSSYVSALSSLLVVYSATTQRDERVLVAWSDNLEGIIPLCRDFEDALIKLVWSHHSVIGTPGPSIIGTPAFTSAVNSTMDVGLNEKPVEEEEESPESALGPDGKPIKSGSWFGWRIGSRAKRVSASQDPEKGGPRIRPTKQFGPFYSGLALALSTCAGFFVHIPQTFFPC